MMKLFPFLLGVSDAVEELVVCFLLEFELRHQFLVHQGVICHLLLDQLISHMVKLQLVKSPLGGSSVGRPDGLIEVPLLLQQ